MVQGACRRALSGLQPKTIFRGFFSVFFFFQCYGKGEKRSTKHLENRSRNPCLRTLTR